MKVNLKAVRDNLKLLSSIVFSIIYIPHILYFLLANDKYLKEDVEVYAEHQNLNFPFILCFLFLIHTNSYFRNLFYYRIGPVLSSLIFWLRPGDKYFVISKTTKIGGGAYFAHPFASEINAESIGSNFSCRHLTTLGNKQDGDNSSRPIIGNNVTLGVNVSIIGRVTIGNNVIIGAGSIVVKDIPNNSVAVGNPAEIIKKI